MSYHTRRAIALWAMLAPFLIGSLALVAMPALLTVGVAFTDYDALSPPRGVWLENFERLYEDPVFWAAARNTALLVLLTVPLRLLAALGLALLLSGRRPGVGIARTAVYLPTVIPDVAYALIWLWIFNPLYGPLNLGLAALGIAGPAWLADPRTALIALALTTLLQIGEGFVVLLAGLHGIAPEYHQAAEVDGAGPLQRLRHITLPLLVPWLVLLAIRDIILMGTGSFTTAYIMTGGGPYYATFTLPLLIYEEAFDRFRFGLGAAALLVLLGVIGLLLEQVYRLLKAWGGEGVSSQG